ncbi:hypothetical protein Avbf_15075, partial [Armadillidium vulgare]
EGSGRLIEYPHTSGSRQDLLTSEARLIMPLSEKLLHEFNLSCSAYTLGLSVRPTALKSNKNSRNLHLTRRDHRETIAETIEVMIVEKDREEVDFIMEGREVEEVEKLRYIEVKVVSNRDKTMDIANRIRVYSR